LGHIDVVVEKIEKEEEGCGWTLYRVDGGGGSLGVQRMIDINTVEKD
jgi:hypothetical protein